MAGSLVDTLMDDRIKARNTLLRIKNFSPKFKTVLRQKFKERIENNRLKVLNKFRHINDIRHVLDQDEDRSCKNSHDETSGMEYELQTYLDFNLDEELLAEEILNEELSQYENWLLQEYESALCEQDADEVIIICPLCCSGRFEFTDSCKGEIICTKCSSKFSAQKSMLDIQNCIFNEVDKHKNHCFEDPGFFKVLCLPPINNLYINCDTCGYFEIII